AGTCADLGGRHGASAVIAARYYHPGAQGGQAGCGMQADAVGPASYESDRAIQSGRRVCVRCRIGHENYLGYLLWGPIAVTPSKLEVNAVCSRTGTASRRPATTRLPPISRTDQTTSKMVLTAAWFPCPRAGSLRGATVAQARRPGAPRSSGSTSVTLLRPRRRGDAGGEKQNQRIGGHGLPGSDCHAH